MHLMPKKRRQELFHPPHEQRMITIIRVRLPDGHENRAERSLPTLWNYDVINPSKVGRDRSDKGEFEPTRADAGFG